MLRILLKTIIISLIFISTSNSKESYSFKFHKLKVDSFSGNDLNRIGSVRGAVEEYPYGFNYYLQSKKDLPFEFIETFYFENYGDHLSRFNNWARNVVYISNPKNGCNNSTDKIYHSIVDNGQAHFNCFSLRVLTSEEDIFGPNFNAVDHIPMGQRKTFLKRYFKKNKLTIPNQMLRLESYFYKSGKLIWVFYTVDSSFFYDELNQEKIKKFVNISLAVHQKYENNLKYKDYMKIK